MAKSRQEFLVRLWLAAVVTALLPALVAAQAPTPPSTDLDRLMEEVVRRRDDNWKKLQQYILTEQERIAVTGPGGLRLFGQSRVYQWFVKEGFFIRSPLTANGVSIGEQERRAYEDRYLRRQKRRDERKTKRDAERGLPAPAPAPDAIGDLLRQQSEPNFISAAYFLRFKFDPGRYALAGRDTIAGKQVLKVEYYPSQLFKDDDDEDVQVSVGSQGTEVSRQERRRKEREREDQVEHRVEQQMNKVSLVTLWILREERQIIRYVFDNIDMGFLPGRSVAHVDELTASMQMREAFAGVWLPDAITGRVSIGTAAGPARFTYDVGYRDYRQAGVTVKVR
jgi:hypothetical protein